MARDDLFDFGDPTDPQKRGLDGQFIGGPKPGGLWDVPGGEGLLDAPRPKKLVGVERLGAGLDEVRRPELKGVERYGRPMGDRRGRRDNAESGPSGRFLLVFVVFALLVAGWLCVQRVDFGPSETAPAGQIETTTTRVVPGSEGRFVMPDVTG